MFRKMWIVIEKNDIGVDFFKMFGHGVVKQPLPNLRPHLSCLIRRKQEVIATESQDV